MPTETQSDKTIEDNVTKMSEKKANNTEVMTDVMEPAEAKEETERVVLANSMMDKSQTNSTRRRTLTPLRPVKVPPLRKPRLQLRKSSKKNTKKSSSVSPLMIS